MPDLSQNDKSADWKWKGKLEKQIKQKEVEPPRDFGSIYKAFSVPLQGRGRKILLLGVLLTHVVMFIPFAGIIFAILIRVLICSYVMQVIAHTSSGKDDLPPWTMENLETEFRTGLTFLGVIIFAFLPALAVYTISRYSMNTLGWLMFAILALAGTFCIPMMLLVGAVSGSFMRTLNLRTIFLAISRAFRPYLLVFGLCLLSVAGMVVTCYAITWVTESPSIEVNLLLELLLSCLIIALSFYCLIVMGFILGRFIYCQDEEIFSSKVV